MKVICIRDTVFACVSVGGIYEAKYENDSMYRITGDDLEERLYPTGMFRELIF